jgi:hypothetical protein
MKDDPIVEEVHQTRRKLLAECDGDLDKYMNRLLRGEEEHRGRLVKSVEQLKATTAGRPAVAS